MIWRLPHPVIGLVAACMTFLSLNVLVGFGMGLPELVATGAVSVLVFFVVATRKTDEAQDR